MTIYFPKQPPVDAYMEALLIGTLVLDAQGCLRVGEESEGGDAICMGGGETTAEAVPGLSGGVCGGPYWAVGAIEPLESQPRPTKVATPGSSILPRLIARQVKMNEQLKEKVMREEEISTALYEFFSR